MRPQISDALDVEILQARQRLFDKRKGARVGDFIDMLDGTRRRFTHDWGDGLQTTTTGATAGDQSFYFGDGYADFSGSLDSTIKRKQIEATGEMCAGWIWFFHHNSAGAGRGVRGQIPFRVFRQTESVTR